MHWLTRFPPLLHRALAWLLPQPPTRPALVPVRLREVAGRTRKR